MNIHTRTLDQNSFSVISYHEDEVYHPVYNTSTKEEAINQVWTPSPAALEKQSN
jgi:hypothetical protein